MTSCEKDESIVEPVVEEVVPDYQAISMARDWFYDQTGGDVLLEVQSQTKSTDNSIIQHPLFGDWESGLTNNIENIKNVEVPVYTVDNEETYAEAINGTGNLKSGKSGTNEENLPSRTRFVVQTDEVTGVTRGFMMTVVPDEEYLAKGGTIDSIDYYHRGKNFSGFILFDHLDGTFANGWKYQDGFVIYGFGPEKSEHNNLKRVKRISVMVCYHVGVGIGSSEIVYSHTTCYVRGELVYCNDAYQENSNTSFSGSGGGGGIATGGSGGYIEPQKPQVKSKTPLTDKIIARSTLDSDQKLLLEDALDELIKNCMEEFVYNEFVAAGVKFDFIMDPNQDGLAGYNPKTKTFSFQDNSCIEATELREELFHAWQDYFYPGGTSQYGKTGSVNIEFEAKLLSDISKGRSGGGCCYAFNVGALKPSDLEDYLDWINSVMFMPSNITSSDYQKWLKKFDSYNPKYSSPFSPNLNNPDALFSLFQLSNC